MGPAHTPGSLVTVRGRDWVVLPESAPDMLVLRPLGGSDDDIAAVFPAVEPVSGTDFAPPSAADLGDAHAAGLLRSALRIGFRSGAGPFRSLAGIAVQPRAYQLVPLMMALRQQTVRILISDDVGIGKTVEAGLIPAELLAQGDARRLAVLCSPALAEQWQQELRGKFGIDAELVLSSTVSRLERDLALGQSLFDKHDHVIVSLDFIKSPRHRDDFLRHCPDLVIVDEAHSCVSAGDTGSRQTQLRHELLRRVAGDPRRHLLLVTATPHSGKEAAFRELLGLLEPGFADLDLTTEAGRVTLARHFVQRKRADIRKYLDEETEFPEDRFFKDETYRLSPAYRALLEDAVTYAGEQVVHAGGRRDRRVAWWSAIAMLRSLVSSPRAAAQTLRTRAAGAGAATAEEADRLGAPLARDIAAEDALEGIDAVPGAQTDANAARLAELAQRAEALEGPETDLKLKLLHAQVKALLKDGYHPIVFCHYIATAEYVAEHLNGRLGRGTVVRAVTGALSPQQRIQRIEELATEAGDAPTARRVLVATDCLSEGVNLQHHFDAVIHYDLAWNPTRHDQREGRVDRYGQRRETVRVITLYGADNGIDGRVLEVLIRKHRQIRRDLGISVSVPDEASDGVTDAIVEWMLLRDHGGEQGTLFEVGDVQLRLAERSAALEAEWKSTVEREKLSRSRFAQHSMQPEVVAPELTAVREALGHGTEIRGFVRRSLSGLDAVLRTDEREAGSFTADLSGSPAGLRDVLAPVIGGGLVEEHRPLRFRDTVAVTRGEVALVRTDPAVAALAGYVLNSALESVADSPPGGPRPARRSGVIRTTAVIDRTVLLLVRYRFRLLLPSRYGERDLIAEDARPLAFEGSPDAPVWLPKQAALDLLEVTAAENTDPAFAERTVERIRAGYDSLIGPIDAYGRELGEELREAHRRVRQASGDVVRGLTVTAQAPADVLGLYVYLPVGGGGR